MTNDDLYAIYQKLNSLEELTGMKANEEDEDVKDFINKDIDKIYLAAFCTVVADIFDEFFLFDEAQLLFEEALARNETDGSLGPDEYETATKDLGNMRNPGYRRFQRLVNSDETDPEKRIEKLKTVFEEGFESADVWGMLGASYADLRQHGKASEAFKTSLEIDDETQELSAGNRETARQYLEEH